MLVSDSGLTTKMSRQPQKIQNPSNTHREKTQKEHTQRRDARRSKEEKKKKRKGSRVKYRLG